MQMFNESMALNSRFRINPTLHVLTYARASWQRLGHLKMLCSVASPSDSTNLEGITSRFQNLISSMVNIPSDHSGQIIDYIKNHRYREYDKRKGLSLFRYSCNKGNVRPFPFPIFSPVDNK